MKKWTLSIWLCCCLVVLAQSQGNFTISNGAYVNVYGTAYLKLSDVHWYNSGTFSAGSSTVEMIGSGANNVDISGTAATTFHHLTTNRSGGDVQLGAGTTVDGNLTFTSGSLDLNGNDLTLGSSNGQIVNETESSRVIGANGGEVIKTVNLNSPVSANPGNIGLEITSTENLGSTEIRRGHDPQDVLGQDGIKRHFTISPNNNSGLDATVRFYYFNGELNSLTEAEIEPWRNDGTNWTNYPVTNSDPTANWVETANIDAFSTWTLGQGAIKIKPKVFLEGPYGSGQMDDALRSASLLPNAEPYTGLGFTQVGGGGSETASPGVFAVTGDDAIVDWVFLELRDKNSNSTVLRTKSALLQRDGDIVDMDGTSPVIFTGLSADDFYIVVSHRNHLGIMSANTFSLSISSTIVDFTSIPTYGTNAQKDLGGGVMGMWGGDINASGTVDASDRSEAWNQRNLTGYLPSDATMNGTCDAGDRSIAWNNRNLTGQLP